MAIPFHKIDVSNDDIAAVVDVMRNGWLTMGQKTFEFEEKFAQFLECSDAVAVSSCTAALHLALVAEGIGIGDEVIVPINTFVATAEVVNYVGATAVFADISKNDHNIDVASVKAAITDQTRAVIAVHFSGSAAPMSELKELCEKQNLVLIEDAAHAFPASYHDKPLGTIGDYGCFSFYATKTISTGEGGMVVAKDSSKLDRVRTLRLHGISKHAWNRYAESGNAGYDILENGYKYNMTDMNAALGISQLKRCGIALQHRQAIAKRYNRAFSTSELLVPYKPSPHSISSCHLYPLRLAIEKLSVTKWQFVDLLKEAGVGTSVHFIPFYEFSYYKDRVLKDDFPNGEWVSKRQISLPIYNSMSSEEVDFVIQQVLSVAKRHVVGGEN